MSNTITLNRDPAAIHHLSRADERLALLFSMVGDFDFVAYEDAYVFMVETIVAQMLSNKVADVMIARLNVTCGGELHPQAVARLSVADLRACGLSNAKSNAILGLTAQVLDGSLNFSRMDQLPDDEVIKELIALRGIGMWSAKMYLIFVLGRPDVLPHEDVAFLQAYAWLYRTEQTARKDVEARCEKWKPYSTTAVRYLYRALDQGLVKTPIDEILAAGS